MATGFASGVAQSILNSLCRATTWTAPAAFYLKLHLADPGAAGATSAAANTVRQAVTFSAASADGTITNSADVTWTSVSTTETYTHVSWWSASSAGTFLGSDDLSAARAVSAGDDFTISAANVSLQLTPLAA